MKLAMVTMPSRMPYVERCLLPFLPKIETIGDPHLSLSDKHEIAWGKVADSDYGLVLHDDIILCDDFEDKLGDRLEEAAQLGYDCVTFYSPRKADLEALQEGKRWRRLSASAFRAEECLAMSGDLINRYLNWLPGGRHENRGWHDYQLSRFFMQFRIPVWTCVPNLVDHDNETRSLMRHPKTVGGRPRVSTTWSPDAR